jgi:hypothetical protein
MSEYAVLVLVRVGPIARFLTRNSTVCSRLLFSRVILFMSVIPHTTSDSSTNPILSEAGLLSLIHYNIFPEVNLYFPFAYIILLI